MSSCPTSPNYTLWNKISEAEAMLKSKQDTVNKAMAAVAKARAIADQEEMLQTNAVTELEATRRHLKELRQAADKAFYEYTRRPKKTIDIYCTKCGTTCYNCPRDAKFCTECGQAYLTEGSSTMQGAADENVEDEKAAAKQVEDEKAKNYEQL
jgi:hypothetical protein